MSESLATQENTRLRRLLRLCFDWMKKEVGQSSPTDHRSKQRRMQRQAELSLKSYTEEYSYALSKQIRSYLLDAEINFALLMRYNFLDGLIVTNPYQKALEEIIETDVIRPWRNQIGACPKARNLKIEKTLYTVLTQKHRLSCGKFLEIILNATDQKGYYEKKLQIFLQGSVWAGLKNENYYLSRLEHTLKRGIFSHKRHLGKVSFEEVLELRNFLLIGTRKHTSLLEKILTHENRM